MMNESQESTNHIAKVVGMTDQDSDGLGRAGSLETLRARY